MSKEIKILLVEDMYNDIDDYNTSAVIKESISDWETVSDEDFEFLRKNMHVIAKKIPAGFRTVIVTKDPLRIAERIESVQAEIDRVKAEREAEQERQRKAQQERERKKLLKTKKTELELLAELKKKYESDNAGNI